MDAEKTRQPKLLLDWLEGRRELPKSLDKQKLFKEVDRKNGFDFQKSGGTARKTIKYSRKWKVAVAVIVIIVTVMVAN